MAKLTPAELAQKWANRISNATADIQRGVQNVTVSPTAQAAKKKDKMLANLTQAVQSGKWERGLNAVTLEQWKEATLNKGVGRIATGAQSAVPKMQQFAEKLIPFQDSLKAKVGAMPDRTLEENIARMAEWARGMSKFVK